MPKQVTALWGRLSKTIRSFTAGQSTVAIIGIAVLVLGVVGLVAFVSQPSYSPLFTGLSASDASAVVDQLNADGVQYQLTDGGATILVPQQSVYTERLKAAANGLPSSSTNGYALLDKMGVTASEFQQNTTYKRAMEGELANTIDAMNGVKASSVKLAIPQDTVFVSSQTDPTASVFIDTDAGVSLSDDQVDAVVHLVSASIENMKTTDVSVVDQNGDVLSSVGTGTSESSDKLTSSYEDATKTSVQAMLDKIVGVGNSTVAVSATVDDSTAQQTSEQYTIPTGNPVSSESDSAEKYSGSGSGTSSGVLGPDNIAVPTGTPSDGAYASDDNVKDNALNKVTTTKQIPAGVLERETVSVAVNKSAATSVTAAQIQQLVKSASGFSSTRGDVVTVQFVSFSQQAAQQAQAALAQQQSQDSSTQLWQIIRTGVIAGIIALAFIIGLVLFLRRSRQERVAVDLPDISGNDFALTDLPGFPLAPEPVVTSIPEQEVHDSAMKRARISNLAASDPARTAALLRGLMEEGTTS